MQENPNISKHNTLNPYRSALGSFYRRLKWDIKPAAWQSRTHLKTIKNSHQGEKAIILCNGPSLLNTPFKLIENVYTFGLNKINLLFNKNNYRPDSIVAVNHLVIEQNRDFYSTTEIPLFLDAGAEKVVKKRKNITFLHSDAQVKFTRDLSMSIWQGGTVTAVAMQLAFHMGFSKVALIGCDHNFAVKGHAHQEVVTEDKDLSHFDPNYFAKGMKWQLPDLVGSEYAYYLASENYIAAGRQLVNCTIGGQLDILPRLTLDEFIKL